MGCLNDITCDTETPEIATILETGSIGTISNYLGKSKAVSFVERIVSNGKELLFVLN
jgi:hypothetical protein